MILGKPLKIIRSNRRTLSLQVLPGQGLVIKAPFFIPQFEINKFINKHQDWIDKRLNHLKETKLNKRNFKDGEKFLFLGKEYNLKVGDYKQISFSSDYLYFPKFMLFRAEKELTSYYINSAKQVIKKQLEFYKNEMNVSIKSVMYSDTRSKWGSCTHDNKLQFCWRLIMAPILVINYVIVHELTHTTIKNHSRTFWNRVKVFNPSYKQQIKWLKQNEHKILI